MRQELYVSENQNKDSMFIGDIVLALEKDYPPYYYIQFVTKHGSKPEWEYISKELRDKEIKEIRELKKNR